MTNAQNQAQSVRPKENGLAACPPHTGREAGAREDGGGSRDFSRGATGEGGPWATLTLALAGGILRQLINQTEDQLAYHRDSVEWYQQEVEKAQSGAQWHERQYAKVQGQLEELKLLVQSVEEIEGQA